MKNILLTCFVIFLLSCSDNKQNNIPVTVKLSDDDPFAKNMIESEFLKKDVTENCFLESKAGTFVFIPEGAFVDHRGKPVKGNIDIEIAETNEPADLILSNLVMNNPQNVIRQEKSFFINATQNGKQLAINPDKPLYIEISAGNKPLQIYHGTREANGDMVWKEVTKPVQYLIPVPLDMLDFLPEGFRATVESGMPYKNHKIATNKLVDSLYYSFSFIEQQKPGYTRWEMINLSLPISLLKKVDSDTTEQDIVMRGIDPASIKAIRSKKFQNTLISTREFETRLQAIFKTCDNEILELYVRNLSKNLWEIDSLAADKLGKSNQMYQTFRDFSNLRQTTVKLSDEQAQALAQEFYNQRKKIEDELQKIREENQRRQERKEAFVQEKAEKYKNLLEKRHEYRMHKFGFELTNTGWYNAAEKISLPEVKTFEMNTTVKNGDKFDRTFVYIVNPQIKSIFSLLSDDNIHFVYKEDPDLLLWENQKFNAVGVGFNKDQVAYSISEHTQQPVTNIEFELKYGDIKKIKEELKPFTRNYSKENKILVDLEYQAFLQSEIERKAILKKEELFQKKLLMKVFPCYPIFLEFKHAGMEDVLNSLSFLYNVSFQITDKAMLQMYFYGYFNINEEPIERALNTISLAADIDFYLQNGQYLVSINKKSQKK